MIRLAHLDDAPGMARVHAQSWRETYGGLFSEATFERNNEAARQVFWHKNLEQLPQNQRVWVALAGEERVGFASAGPWRPSPAPASKPSSSTDGELYAMYVLESAQGQGIGQALFGACAAWFGGNGHSGMRWWVIESNAKAMRFYERAGGQRIGQTSFKENGQTVAERLMRVGFASSASRLAARL